MANQYSALGEAQRLARTHAIFAAHRKGELLQQIADTHGISRERVRQILLSGRRGRTLSLLPGTETLSPLTRGLLIRMGYRRAAAIHLALKTGMLYDGCTFGMGTKRFSEIEAWARERDSKFDGATTPSNVQRAARDAVERPRQLVGRKITSVDAPRKIVKCLREHNGTELQFNTLCKKGNADDS